MKIRLKPKALRQFALTAGNIYRVIGIEADYFRIMDNHGVPGLYPPKHFAVIDDAPGVDWQFEVGDGGEMYAYPPELSRSGFFEDYFDGKKRPRAILQAYLRRLTAAETLHKLSPQKRQTRAA